LLCWGFPYASKESHQTSSSNIVCLILVRSIPLLSMEILWTPSVCPRAPAARRCRPAAAGGPRAPTQAPPLVFQAGLFLRRRGPTPSWGGGPTQPAADFFPRALASPSPHRTLFGDMILSVVDGGREGGGGFRQPFSSQRLFPAVGGPPPMGGL